MRFPLVARPVAGGEAEPCALCVNAAVVWIVIAGALCEAGSAADAHRKRHREEEDRNSPFLSSHTHTHSHSDGAQAELHENIHPLLHLLCTLAVRVCLPT